MNTVQLECFLAVAQYLNFSKAAESVSITQPAVSHQIGSLEDELGVKLFVRTSKSVSLTREGIMFISDAEQILKIAGSAKFRLSEKLEDEPVRISIGCHNQAELNVLTPALREMSRLYDDLLPYIDLTPFKSIDNQLKDQKIQLLLSLKVLINSLLTMWSFAAVSLCVFARKITPLQRRLALMWTISQADLFL